MLDMPTTLGDLKLVFGTAPELARLDSLFDMDRVIGGAPLDLAWLCAETDVPGRVDCIVPLAACASPFSVRIGMDVSTDRADFDGGACSLPYPGLFV